MSRMGLAQKVPKIAFTILFSTAHAQCPATFHWLEKITCPWGQVRLNPFSGKSKWKNRWNLAGVAFFLLSPASQMKSFFSFLLKATIPQNYWLGTQGRIEPFSLFLQVVP
jgi:hypothetical protein